MLAELLSLTACMVCRGERLHSSAESTSADAAAASTSRVTHVAIKAMNEDEGDNAQLAQHEAQVLESLSNRDYVPCFHGYHTDPETKRWHRRAYVFTQ